MRRPDRRVPLVPSHKSNMHPHRHSHNNKHNMNVNANKLHDSRWNLAPPVCECYTGLQAAGCCLKKLITVSRPPPLGHLHHPQGLQQPAV